MTDETRRHMTDETIRQLTWYTDPAHGWLQVPRSDLAILGITNQISPFSHTDTIYYAYLEEDLDAETFMHAAERHGWTIDTVDRHTNRTSSIRNLPSYKP